jgi:hypothetical protein
MSSRIYAPAALCSSSIKTYVPVLGGCASLSFSALFVLLFELELNKFLGG